MARTSPLALAALVALTSACRPEAAPPESLSPTAAPEIVEALRQDLATERHPSDGKGRAWLEPDPEGRDRVTAAGSGRWTLVFEAGPDGIVVGGAVYLQVSPFWGWSTPQAVQPEGTGFTEVATDAEGVELEPATIDQQLLEIRIAGRELAAGERIRIVYGAGPAGARADRFAERESRFWLAVDGNGDGIRGLLDDAPAVEVAAGPAERLIVTVASTARPGNSVRVRVAAVDRFGNAAGYDGSVELQHRVDGEPAGATTIAPDADGRHVLELRARRPGVHTFEATGNAGLIGDSNPLWVDVRAPRICWADLHGHSGLSDGTGTPEDFLRYARDVAGLDAVALTDHDHWGMRPLVRSPDLWERIRAATRDFHRPGDFVTLLGYEWTSWLHGHRHVLYFEDAGEVLSSVDPNYETPQQLWDALRGQPALTFAHHSAGGPVATNWDFAPDPELEPVTEIVSVHGSSEAPDSPTPIYSPVAGNWVRDVLDRGYRLGLIGSGDSHDGHPGLSHLAAPSGGLAALLCDELTREGVRAALRERRTYATNGARIVLRARLAGARMGSVLAPAALRGGATLEVDVLGEGPIESVDVVRSGEVAARLDAQGRRQVRLEHELEGLRRGDYVYVRAVQENGGAAWSSPFFVDAP